METNRFLVFFQHLYPAMPEIHVDIVISKFTYVWLLKLLTKQFSHLFIWLKIIFIEFRYLQQKVSLLMQYL